MKMKKNSVARYGTKRRPCSPMTSSMIPIRTKSTMTSMKFWRPVGTMAGLRNASRNSVRTTIDVKNVKPTVLLMHRSIPATFQCGVRHGQTKSSVVGVGNPSLASRIAPPT